MRIHMSHATAQLLQASGQGFDLTPRGPVQVKGKGVMQTWWLSSSPDSATPPAPPAAAAVARTSLADAPVPGSAVRLNAATRLSAPGAEPGAESLSGMDEQGRPLAPAGPVGRIPPSLSRILGVAATEHNLSEAQLSVAGSSGTHDAFANTPAGSVSGAKSWFHLPGMSGSQSGSAAKPKRSLFGMMIDGEAGSKSKARRGPVDLRLLRSHSPPSSNTASQLSPT